MEPPVASSSSWSGVHIHVTAGAPFTSSQDRHLFDDGRFSEHAAAAAAGGVRVPRR